MSKLPAFLISLWCIALAGCANTGVSRTDAALQCEAQPQLAKAFGAIEGTFVLLDPQTGRMVCHNAERARTRFLPASTFKIPNSVIALDSGVASGPEFEIKWNREAAPPQPWWPATWAGDQTMRTALPNSVVWYYKEIARRIGPERMQRYLDRFDYGNRDISGGIDRFWLTGALRISAEEQVGFLRRFYFEKLGVSPGAVRSVKDLIVLEATSGYRLSGKTGWAGLGGDAPQIGWLVGYLERNGAVYFYATNIEIKTDADAKARLPITKAALRSLGLLDAPGDEPAR